MTPQNFRDWATLAVALFNAAVFIALLVSVMLVKDQELHKTLLTMMVQSGVLNFGTVVQYYMGSSKGSEKKDEIIARKEP